MLQNSQHGEELSFSKKREGDNKLPPYVTSPHPPFIRKHLGLGLQILGLGLGFKSLKYSKEKGASSFQHFGGFTKNGASSLWLLENLQKFDLQKHILL